MPLIPKSTAHLDPRQFGDVGGAIGGAANTVAAGGGGAIATAASAGGGAAATAASAGGGAVATAASAGGDLPGMAAGAVGDKMGDELQKQVSGFGGKLWDQYGNIVLAIVGVIVAAIVLSVGFCCYKSCRSRKSLPSRPEQSKGKEMEYEPRGDASRPPSFQVSPRGSYYQSGGSQSYR